MAATGVLMCGPAVFLRAGQTDFASPETTGWFRKKKKNDTKDSIPSKSAYEKLTGDGAVVRKGMFNVYQKKNDYYEIIAGERRWRAAKLAGLKEVPVLVREYTEQEVVEISLIENIQRENLNPIEEAIAYKRLLKEFHLKQDEIAERVSKSRTAVTNSMRLLKLNSKVQQMVIDDMISTGHARALLALEDEEQQYTIANKIFDEKLSVRETEKLIKILKNPKKTAKKEKIEHTFIYENLEEKMKGIMGTKVNVNPKSNGKGKIEIEYYSEEELERIFDLIMSIQS